MSFRFVHAADLHLDTPFSGLGAVSPALQETLRDASLEAWDALVTLTIEQKAAFLLLAGDIYDGPERGIRAQLRFLQGLRRLSAEGIQTFIVHGNHDPLGGWSAIRDMQDWPEGVTVFGSDGVRSGPVVRDGQILATIHGISFGRPDVRENLAWRFARGPEPGIHIGLLHCNVGSQADHHPYSPCSLADLARAQLDYWALGHVHTRQILSRGHPWVVYPGNLQGRSPKPAERGKKGALVVEVVGSAIAEPRFVELDRVRFDIVSVDIGAVSDLGGLLDALIAAMEDKRAEHGNRGLILRATLEGQGDVHDILRRPAALAELLRELRVHGSSADPFVWWDEIEDRTRSRLDRATIRQRDDFSGMLVQYGERLLADPAALQAFASSCTGGLDTLLATRARRELLEEESYDVAALLDQAIDEALDLLAGGGQ